METSRPLEPGYVGMRDAVYKKGDIKELTTTSAEEMNATWAEHFREVYDAEITTPKFTRLLYHPKSNELAPGRYELHHRRTPG